ncbi:MAG: hypothetical protein EOO45_08300, partial [Flavobacterium sp.]
MKKSYLYLFLLTFIGINIYAQSPTAEEMSPFCAGGNTLTFTNTTGEGNANPGSAQNYGCLSTTPNPAWFYMQVGQSGTLNFFISQVDNNGQGIDVDFIAWGPFSGPPPIFGPSNLNSNTQVGCSYSANATESFSIPGAQSGQYYVVLLTNYSDDPGQISLTQTNIGQNGAGTTNCDIVCPLTLGGDFELCPGSSATITASIEDATSYQWTNGNGVIQGQTGPSLVVTGPGTYTVIVNKPGCVANASASVTVTEPESIDIGAPDDLSVCAVGPGPYTYNLSENADAILNGLDPDFFALSYHTSQNDANEGVPTIPSTYQSNGGQTVFVRVEDFTTGCFATTSFQLLTNPGPTANQPLMMPGCDDDDDGLATFNLLEQNADILLGQNAADYIITYHTTFADADDNGPSIGTPQAYQSGDRTVYVRVTSVSDVDCYATTSFALEVTTLPDDVTSPTPIEICDDVEGDGQAQFDLTPAINEITAQEPGMTLTITLHANQADADSGASPLSLPSYTTNETQNQTVYFRVIEAGSTNEDCYTTVALSLTVNQKPEIPAIADFELCDQNNSPDGIEEFDLTVKNDEITGNDTTLTVSYYLSQANASAPVPTGAIANPSTHTNTASPNQQTIYVRVDSPEGCFSTSSFNLIVNPLPLVTQGLVYNSCEISPGQAEFNLSTRNAEISQSAAGVTVTYFETLLAAQDGTTGAITATPYVSGPRTVYARVENTATQCYEIAELQLDPTEFPQLGTATPLEVCDNDGNAAQLIGTFNLTPAINEILNGETNLTATVHTSLANANLGTAPQSQTAFTNTTSGTQTVFVRVELTGSNPVCFQVETIALTVNPNPVIAPIANFELCDDNNAGDGIEQFDLTVKNDEITANNPALTVTYYLNQADASAPVPTGAIANPANHSNTASPNEQTIWTRVQDANGCYAVRSFLLVVKPLPAIATAQAQLFACEETPGEGEFNLSDADAQIIQNPNYVIRYYTSQLAANGGGNDNITQNPYSSANRTLFVRVDDPQTGCTIYTTLELEVLPAPIAPAQTPLEECDFNNDGVAAFNLDAVIAQITAQLGNVTVTVHETIEDAQFDENPITNTASYTNVTGFTNNGIQTVFILVQSAQTECFDIVELDLIVRPVPEATTPAPYQLCDDDEDGIAIFDLSTKQAEILGALNPA